MQLDKNLLVAASESWQLPPDLYARGKDLGSYNATQFVLRLRGDVHRALASLDPDARAFGDLLPQQIQAFSTYFHETLHWWQHVGSTLGLILSLLSPAQAHYNKEYLDRIARQAGTFKSLHRYNIATGIAHSANENEELINVVLNNWHDAEFFRYLVCDPQHAEQYLRSPYFDCQAHSFEIALSSVLWLLSATFDPHLQILPDPRKWRAEFQRLRAERARGFYGGSPVHLPPIGARSLFEGQARFCQIQHLHAGSGNRITWGDLQQAGMLEGIYREAFDVFLAITGARWPGSPSDPTVGLFLLICDLAINPGDGFPFDLVHVPSVVESVDPGLRFLMLCQSVANSHSGLLGAITEYSKTEYLEVGATLCKALVCEPPAVTGTTVVRWCREHSGARQLLEEDESFAFAAGNLPVRVLFSRFLRFQMDKLEAPQFFCWPGVWSVDRPGSWTVEDSRVLFQRHEALFQDGPNGVVYPRRIPGKDEATLSRTFNQFYASLATYELARQWVMEDGAFDFDFSWLTTEYPRGQVQEWAIHYFQQIYGVNPKAFRIL